jgi:YesN/AraC family two-component response regulator
MASRIMIVDDEKSIRFLTKQLLSQAYPGAGIFDFPDGDSAIAGYDAIKPVDVLLSDYKMPGRDGVEVAKHVKGDRPGTKTFIISGYLFEVEKEHPEYRNFVDFFDTEALQYF